MKKNIMYLMCGLLSLSMLFTACSEEETITPEFPSEVSQEIASEGTQTITITANVAWSVELSNKVDFYIQDGDAEVYTMHGQAGEHTITVCAREVEDFDADRTCQVNMTMGGQTKTVATLTIKKTERIVTVYAAEVDEDGSYVGEYDEEDNFIYTFSEAAAESLVMNYNFEDGYTSAVKVNANFNWIVEAPAWMLPVEGGAANTDNTIVFEIDPENFPASGTEAAIKFLDANDNTKVGGQINITFVCVPHTLRVGWIEEPAYFKENDGSHWSFTEPALENFEFMNYYEAYYVTTWDSETSIRTSKAIKSFRAYSYTDSESMVEITGEESWLSGSVQEYAPYFFSIIMDSTMATAETAKNENTGELEGVLVIEFIDGTKTAVFCHYKAPNSGGDDVDGDIKIVSDYADLLGITFVEVVEGDADYDPEWAGMGVPQYRLTYTQVACTAALSFPAESELMTTDNWITYEGDASYMNIYMNPVDMELPAKGKLQVTTAMFETIAIIYCVYNVEQ